MMNKSDLNSLTLLLTFILMTVTSACATPDAATEEADPAHEADPEVTAIDDDYEASKLDSIFAEMDYEEQPGVVAGVFEQGDMIYNQSLGLANLDHNITLSDSSRFFMGELSKQVTAAAAGVLIHRDSLGMDDSISDFIDEWPDWAEEIRIEHLIYHTSGLPEVYELIDITDHNIADPMDLDEYIEIITKAEELNFEPGSEFNYNNSGYKILAGIIENVADKDLNEFAKEVLFEPLGMDETHIQVDRSKVVPNRVISYSGRNNNYRQEYMNMFQGYGPVGMYTSLRDIKKWEQMRVNEDPLGKGRDFRDLLITAGSTNNGEEVDYAFGKHLGSWKGQDYSGHDASFMGYRHYYRHFPEHEISVLVMSNRSGFNAQSLVEEIAELLLDQELKAWMEPYTGSFYNDELDVTYELKTKDGRLYLNRPHSDESTLSYDDVDKWSMGSWEFVFDGSDNHKAEQFKLSTGRAREVEFVRKND